MKTLALIVTTLLGASLIISSCGKDNSVSPHSTGTQELAMEKSERQEAPRPDEDEIMVKPISNYPDPFVDETTIQFDVWTPTKVSLIIFNANNERVEVLMGQFLNEGTYMQTFDARNLPAGKYYAKLRVGSSEIIEEMTKLSSIHVQDPGWN